MASSNVDEILSYKPGKAVPCDDERVVFPDKLVIGIIDASTYGWNMVIFLRSALHGVVEASKLDVKPQTSTENKNEYLTDSVSVITTLNFLGLGKVEDLKDLVRNLAGKVGCMVLLVNPFCIANGLPLIKVIKEITGRFPLCAVLSALRHDASERAKNDLIHNGITDVYELAVPNFSERSQLQWLGFLQRCLQEGDRALAANGLKEIKLARGTSSSEDSSTEGMGRSDASRAGEEPPDDEFANILNQVADDLYDEADIDSLGGQLGILHGDIKRALMTNVKLNRVTSDGTRHMLNQWRRGVSREDERMELRKALQAAKLVNLADLYLREDTQIDAEYADDQQLSTRDETSIEQDHTEGHTDTKVLRGATASKDHTSRDGHTGDMASETREDLTDGSRSQHPDKSLKRSTEKFDASEVTSEDVSSGEVNAGDDMTDLSTRDETSQEQDQTEGHTDTQVLWGATASNDHTPLDEHTEDMAPTTREDLTDGSRSQHPDKPLQRSTEKFDASAVTSEDVSSGEANAGDDMTDVSSIQPAEPSSSHERQILPEDISEIVPLVSSGEKPNEESTTLDKSHVGGIISDVENLISQLVLIDTFPEKILLLFLLQIAMDVSQKTFEL